MRKFLFVFAFVLAASSCDIAYINEAEPAAPAPVQMTANTTIAALKALYTKPGDPVYINKPLVIAGQVTSSDRSGNLYRSLYIQDATGAIELKIGKSSMYDDYRVGQWLYVNCKGLTLGAYGGMVQLGYYCENGGYETSYMDAQYLINSHVFKGKKDTPLAPEVIDGSKVNDEAYWGRYVRFENLTYGNKIFTILYDDAKPNSNSIYLRDEGNYGVTTWAMSQNGFKAYMTPNGKVEPQKAFNGAVTANDWQGYWNAATAYSVSQYFKCGSKDIQVRTSGYAKFADTQIDEKILSGAKVNMNGILTYYNGNNQLIILDLDDVQVVEPQN